MKKIISILILSLITSVAFGLTRGDIKNRIVKDEPKIKSAVWRKNNFAIGVFNDGTSRDGYAQYVCSVLNDDYKLTGVSVSVYDIVKITKGKWVKIGKSYCK